MSTYPSRRRRAWCLLTTACLVLLATTAAQPLAANASTGSSYYRTATAARVIPRALALAATRSTKADRVLVAQAKILKRCLSKHPRRPEKCKGARRGVQQAGNSLAIAERRLSRVARSTGQAVGSRGAAGASALQAPHLTVSGQRLTWNTVAGLNAYVLVRRVPGQPDQYSVISGTSTTPPPVPGITVHYSVRTSVNNSAWAGEQSIAYASTTETPNAQAAPAISVSGKTLVWNAVAGIDTYVLVSKVPGEAYRYSVVSGTSTTPTPVPGATVSYSVRTAVDGSAWASEVPISYQAATPTPVPTLTLPPPPLTPTQPSSPSTPADPGFEPGVDSGWDLPEEPDAAAQIGVKVVRVEFQPRESPAEIEKFIRSYAEKGIRVAPLAGFEGTLPTPEEARNLASWATAYGPGGTFWANRSDGYLAVQSIEFGNETSGGYQYGDEPGDASYTARAQTYAVRLKEASEAISAAGMKVGLLAVAEDPTGDWMNGMFSAVPNLGNYVAGWVSHLYGPNWRPKIEDLISQTTAHGASATIPIDVTEWGISGENLTCVTEDYGWNPCMNYQDDGEALRKSVDEIRQTLGNRLGLFILYQLRDEKPVGATTSPYYYFGILQNSMQPKGTYTTAAEELLAE